MSAKLFGIWDLAIGVVIAVAVVWAFKSGGWRMLWLAGFGSLALMEATVLLSWAGGAREGNLIVTMAAAAIPALTMTLSVPVLARLTSQLPLQVVGALVCGAIALFVAAALAFSGSGL
jgi:hypothetical protein